MHRRLFSHAAAALLFASSLLEAADWPQWRGPSRTGISPERISVAWPAEGPKQLWKAQIGEGYSSMAISDGRLYTMGNTADVDTVYCFDAKTGKELWKHSYSCSAKDPNGYPGTRVTPTVDGDRVYTLSRQGQFFCLSAGNGAVLWSKDFARDFHAPVPEPGTREWWGYSGAPLVQGTAVIVETGAPGASVVALDRKNGEVTWKAGDDAVGYSSIMPFSHGGQRCLAVFSAAGIVGRSAADGKELWRHPWKTSYNVNAATPIVHEDKVFISSGYNTGCALIQFSEPPPKVVWQSREMRNHVNSSVLWEGHLYGFDGNVQSGSLKCIDWNTGEKKWEHKGYGVGSVIVASGKLIIYSDTGAVAIAEASPRGFQELAQAQVLGGKSTWTPPALANGKLYCRSHETLVCLDVSGE